MPAATRTYENDIDFFFLFIFFFIQAGVDAQRYEYIVCDLRFQKIWNNKIDFEMRSKKLFIISFWPFSFFFLP